MKLIKLLLIFSIIWAAEKAYTQELVARPDSLCIQAGEQFTFNVLTNDIFPPTASPNVIQVTQDPCFRIDNKGKVTKINSTEPCCGTHLITYRVTLGNLSSTATLTVVVKCPKPNCTLVDLEADKAGPAGTTPPSNGGKKIYYACQDNPITYFVSNLPGYTYTWTVGPSGTGSPGGNPAEIVVNWNTPGPSTLVLTTFNGVTTTTETFCIDVLPAPIASFTTLMNCVCNNSPISFTNTSIGASSYFWDFGDTNTSTQTNPTHTYSGPGTYTVTLYAYSNNVDPNGNPLCCCVDSTQMTITVDPLNGPDILWISTLCEGDTSKYWTTATGCTYLWSVFDANGNPILAPNFTGQGNDTICVIWGSGPYGYVTLQATGCPTVCPKPVTALVPIISSVENIDGETIVCAGSKETYTLPKWNGTLYNWTVTGGMLVSENGGHEAVIMWGNGPTGTIHVDYHNPFLQGLPGHDGEDCTGHADLTVNIRPEYSINQIPPQICKGGSISIATSLPSPPTQFTWTIDPPQPGWPIVGVNSINPTFNNIGFYTICVYPNNPTYFCNDTICTSVNVTSIAPPDSISGDKLMCPGQPTQYTAYHSNPSVQYDWTVIGGSPSSYTGNPISVTWNTVGPYSISVNVTDLAAPYCMSSSISCPITKRTLNGPLTLTGGNYCINSVQPYSIGPVQDPLATYTWSITNFNTDGSVFSGQGSPNVQIQWNNTPGSANIRCVVKLCGDSLVLLQPITLQAPILPNIVQTGVLCNGMNATLSPGAGPFTSATWSGGTPSGLNTSVSSAGLYVVTTTDINGCTAKDSYTVNAIPAPYTTISTPDLEIICLPNPGYTVNYSVVPIPGVSYQWYCNGNPVTTSSPTNTTFTHTVPAGTTPAVFNYQVKITDNVTMCMGWSNVRQVVHQYPCITPPCSSFPPPTVNITSTSNTPLCNKFNFGYTVTGGTITPLGWTFGDPFGTLNSPSLTSPMFTYSDAGIYQVSFTFSYTDPANVTCTYTVYSSVTVPVSPKFTCVLTGICREVKFTDISGVLGTTITSHSWNFGDLTTGSGVMVTHTYANPGTYNVTLTITTVSGCILSITKPVVVPGVSTASYSATPMTVCVGENVSFNYLGNPNDILTYLYSFGDLSFNGGPSPQHAYLAPANPYTTTLTVTDIYNCTATSTKTIVVNPNPAPDTIKYTPSLTVCAGQSVTLTAPTVAGATYMWNTLATTQSITVNTAGVYSVTVTDPNNCKLIPDSVEVIILPLPNAQISGSHFICGNDCITLNATLGYNYNYQWYDELGNAITGAIFPNFQVCYPSPFQDSVYVEVTDANGCTAASAWWTISNALAPNLSVSMAPAILCAGTPNLLTASTTSPNVSFLWSTGATSATIIAIQQGSYTVYATDTITGCSANLTKIVNPIPDFCELPSGCYEVCNPDTLCGPPSMASYQWNFNGLPIAGATSQCLEVTMNGSYSLTAVNSFGCAATSDTLILQTIICCDSLDTDIQIVNLNSSAEGCCVKLTYSNTQDSLLGLYVYSNNADLMLTDLSPSFNLIGNTASSLTLESSTPGAPLPVITNDFLLRLCAKNVVTSPVVVYFSWLGPDGEHLCLDSISFECNPNECVYIESDSIACDPQTDDYLYTVTICNPITNNFSFRYIDIIELAPVGVSVVPSALTVAPIAPGTCRTFTFAVTGSNLANHDFCFNLVAHEYNPSLIPTAKCCSIDTTHCIFLPGCSPCDSTYVKEILHGEDSCCFNLVLNNYHDANLYTGIAVCALTTGASVTLNNYIGSGWTTTSLQPTNFELSYNAGNLPLGDIDLPEFCIENSLAAQNSIEIKWLSIQNGAIVPLCRDTIEAVCDNGCGYFQVVKVLCKDPNYYSASLIFHNFSNDTVYSASISFIPNTPGNNVTINFGAGVPPGGTYGPFNVTLGPSFPANSIVCMVANLHNSPRNQPTTTCCQFKTNIQLPNCGVVKCECDPQFEIEVEKGINCLINGNTVTFTPIGQLTPCDQVIWEFAYNQSKFITIGNESYTHTFPGKGEYQVCMTVLRTTPSGKQCKVKIVKEVTILTFVSFNLSPNPTSFEINVNLRTNEDVSIMQKLSLINQDGRIIKQVEEYTDRNGNIRIPLDDVKSGVYVIRLESNGSYIYKKFIKIE